MRVRERKDGKEGGGEIERELFSSKKEKRERYIKRGREMERELFSSYIIIKGETATRLLPRGPALLYIQPYIQTSLSAHNDEKGELFPPLPPSPSYNHR